MNLSSLNPPQREAVRHGDGPLLLLAGAGSGKTRVITYRIAHLVRQRGAPPGSILAVTFTNKAAREMQSRVAKLVGRDAARAMTISTFHALGVRLLRADIERLGYRRGFTILDAGDQQRLVRDLLQELLPPGLKVEADAVLWRISGAKGRLLSPEQFVADPRDELAQLAAEVYPRYQRRLRAHNAVDFDDLLLLAVRLLQEHPQVLTACRDRFRHILVDEYQDTNPAQYRLLRLLADGHRNLCVVGDDDQSIYGWRGADLGNILDFEQDFPGTQVIRLEQNYRSTGTILAAANAVIRHNARRKPKALWSAGADGEPIALWECDTDEAEGRAIAEGILTERFRDPRPFRDFAILYRTNAQSRAFEEQLRYAGIPYVLIGGQQFFDRKEVKDVLAYLRVLVNPLDEPALLRILNVPRRGIGDTTAERLLALSTATRKPLWQVLRQPALLTDLTPQAQEAVAGFIALLERWRRRFAEPVALVEDLRGLLGELRYTDEIYRGASDPAAARRRAENVDEVVNAMAGYVQREVEPTLLGFLEKVALLDDGSSNDDRERKLEQDTVTLMSLHASKGLEFPIVFLAGLEEELLPHGKSGTDVEEERRLCYVGITRARERLILTRAGKRRQRGQYRLCVPSRFLQEIPPELVQRRGAAPATEAQEKQLAGNFFAGIQALLGNGDD